MTSYLKVSGTNIVDGDGNQVILRGAGLGGWMKYVPSTCRTGRELSNPSRSMENFISGYPGCEFQIRAALADVVGIEKSAFFFDKVRGSNGCPFVSLTVSDSPVLGVFLPEGGCQVLQKPRVELHPFAVQLQAFRR